MRRISPNLQSYFGDGLQPRLNAVVQVIHLSRPAIDFQCRIRVGMPGLFEFGGEFVCFTHFGSLGLVAAC
ncbi:hypothetical protein D3C78_1506440 [compost metagenome]